MEETWRGCEENEFHQCSGNLWLLIPRILHLYRGRWAASLSEPEVQGCVCVSAGGRRYLAGPISPPTYSLCH